MDFRQGGAMNCPVHALPAFGCPECIKFDRETYDRIAFDAWRKTYKPPPCPDCSAVMCVEDYARRHGKLVAEVVCQREGCDHGLDVEVI